MNKEIKNFAIFAMLTLAILVIAQPRKSKSKVKGFKVPQSAQEIENEFANAVISIKAYRSAKKSNEPQSKLDELNRELLKEYNIRVIDKSGQLIATDRQGKPIAKENV